jgi:type IV secretion system protein VirB4
MPGLVKVLSGTSERVEEMESLIARHGPEVGAWLPHYCGDTA